MNTVTRGESNRQLDERAELVELYDDYRTAHLNEKYYGCRLASTQRCALWLDVFIGIGTVIGFAIITLDIFHSLDDLNKLFPKLCVNEPFPLCIEFSTVVLVLTGLVAIVATVKPFLFFEKKVERYTTLYVAYSKQTSQLKRIAGSVRIQRGLTDELRQKIENVRDFLDELVALEDPRPRPKHLEALQKEVNRAIPPGALYWPEDEKAGIVNDA